MMKLPYRELKIWKKSIDLAYKSYKLTASFPNEERFGLTNQIRRAAVSIPSNIAEGSQRNSEKEFAHFIGIAKGSLAELETQCIIAESLDYLQKNPASEIYDDIEEMNKMLYAFKKALTAVR